MRRLARRLLYFIPILWLSGCRLLNPTDPLDELDHAYDLWATRGYDSYSYEVIRSCFCGLPGVGRVVVVVVHDWVPVAAWNADTGEPFGPGEVAAFPTVEDLFDLAEDAIRHADRFTIEYDDRLGYPRVLDIDYLKNAIDDELFVGSSRLEPIG